MVMEGVLRLSLLQDGERYLMPYLSFADKESNEGILTDKHTEAASNVLAKQFPGIQGLQSTILCQNFHQF